MPRKKPDPLESAAGLEAFLRAEAEARPTTAVVVCRPDGTLLGTLEPPQRDAATIVAVGGAQRPAQRPKPFRALHAGEGYLVRQEQARRFIELGLARRKKPITIARELEAAGYRTPNGGRKWKAALVKKLAGLAA